MRRYRKNKIFQLKLGQNPSIFFLQFRWGKEQQTTLSIISACSIVNIISLSRKAGSVNRPPRYDQKDVEIGVKLKKKPKSY